MPIRPSMVEPPLSLKPTVIPCLHATDSNKVVSPKGSPKGSPRKSPEGVSSFKNMNNITRSGLPSLSTKSTQAIESASLTVTSEEDGGEELVKVVNIQENSNAQDETVSTNVAANTPKSVASFTCNTTKLGTEIKVTSNGHCISFNSVTPERSVALVLKALGPS